MTTYVLFMQQLEVNSNMALALGNLLGAVANIRSAVSHEKTLKSFLNNINDFGVQVKNNFEVNFSGLEEITFRVQDIKLPSVKANTTEVHFDGHSVPIVVNYDFDHDFSMTFINDADGYIYSAISELIMSDLTTALANGGYTMIVKALTGDDNYAGTKITCAGVRLTNIDGLDFSQSANDIQTFSVSGTMQKYSVAPGALGTAASIFDLHNNLLG